MTTVATASGPSPSVRPPALPVELTTFIGREAELRTLEGLLDAGRLLTLTGAGGSGKTRLAVELAARAGDRYPDGVAWVELAALSDPALLPRHVAAALGIPEDGGRTGTEALAEYLQRRTLLLLLDNCEHLADACAALADALLRASPGLTLLATSREALGVAGERAWLVPPLSVPDVAGAADPERLAESEAVRLFVARAQDVLPSFRLTPANGPAVAAICRRLDGVPLAIELAAARVRVLPPEQISQRLDNVFGLLTSSSRLALPRHRTLRATIDWSYQLLEPPARTLLQRLSVFSGGCGIDAVEAVGAGDGIDAGEVLDLLAGLVDRSLVTMREHEGDARYSLLEIVRQYAGEALAADAAAETAARHRHAAWYMAAAESVLDDLERTSSPDALARMLLEHDNARAALHWSLLERNDLDLAVRIAAAYWRCWFHANHWTEGARWCEAMVAAVPERPARPMDVSVRGRVLARVMELPGPDTHGRQA